MSAFDLPDDADAPVGPTAFLDYDAPAVREFAARAAAGGGNAREQAVRLYYAVRDGLRYEIYDADLSSPGLRASTIIQGGSGLCIHKSVAYAAAARALGIPARLVLTDVRNHLTSPRLREFIGGDVFHYHCLVSVRLDGRWIRATPVFNKTLCHLYGIAPLEFDGRADSLHHPYDCKGRRYMEFVREHGEFDDLPYDRVIRGLHEAHPNLFAGEGDRVRGGALAAEAPFACLS